MACLSMKNRHDNIVDVLVFWICCGGFRRPGPLARRPFAALKAGRRPRKRFVHDPPTGSLDLLQGLFMLTIRNSCNECSSLYACTQL